MKDGSKKTLCSHRERDVSLCAVRVGGLPGAWVERSSKVYAVRGSDHGALTLWSRFANRYPHFYIRAEERIEFVSALRRQINFNRTELPIDF